MLGLAWFAVGYGTVWGATPSKIGDDPTPGLAVAGALPAAAFRLRVGVRDIREYSSLQRRSIQQFFKGSMRTKPVSGRLSQ